MLCQANVNSTCGNVHQTKSDLDKLQNIIAIFELKQKNQKGQDQTIDDDFDLNQIYSEL